MARQPLWACASHGVPALASSGLPFEADSTRCEFQGETASDRLKPGLNAMRYPMACNMRGLRYTTSAVLLSTLAVLSILTFRSPAAPSSLPDEPTLELPAPGACQLRILSPTILELTLITTKPPDPAPVQTWDFVSTNGQLHLPDAKEIDVKAGGDTVQVKAVGFRRRVLYAPLKKRDLRIGNYLYLQLARPIDENKHVEVNSPSGTLWPVELHFSAAADPRRWSPAIHVNQVGYLPDVSKKAMVGYYLGSLGELDVGDTLNKQTGETSVQVLPGFELLESSSGKVVHQGHLAPRRDKGFTFAC